MIQSRIASLVASFSVLVPNSTGAHLGAEQAHALDVRALAAHVLGAHVDDALEAEARADGRGRDAVLAGAGLGDDPRLAEPLREHGLAERVVQLVRAGVEQVLALQVEALAGREPLGERQRRRAAGVLAPEPVELRGERRVAPAPPPSPRRARRAPGSASRGRTGRRTRRSVTGRPPTNARTSSWSLTPGARLEARARVDRPRPHRRDRLARRSPGRARRRARPVPRPSRARSRWSGSVLLPRQVGDRRDLLAVAEQHAVAAAHLALLGAGRAGRGRHPSPRPRRRRRRPTAPCPGRRARPAAARGEAGSRMKPQRSAPASTATATSSSRVRPQTFTSGRETSSRSFAPGSAARISAVPTRIASAPASSAAAPWARVWIALSATTIAVPRARGRRARAARCGRSRRSRGRAR